MTGMHLQIHLQSGSIIKANQNEKYLSAKVTEIDATNSPINSTKLSCALDLQMSSIAIIPRSFVAYSMPHGSTHITYTGGLLFIAASNQTRWREVYSQRIFSGRR